MILVILFYYKCAFVNNNPKLEPHLCIDLITRGSLDVYPESFEEFPLGLGDLVQVVSAVALLLDDLVTHCYE